MDPDNGYRRSSFHPGMAAMANRRATLDTRAEGEERGGEGKCAFIKEGENGIEAGSIAKMLWKFLKFSVKSSFILILFFKFLGMKIVSIRADQFGDMS